MASRTHDYPPTGQLVDIGGYRLHAHRLGHGRPPVVMDAGLGATSLLYEVVLPRIAEFTTALAYDRAGYAWSDAAPTQVPRTSSQLVNELRVLLTKLGLIPPYVLVGNSFGAINCLVYADQYPDEVAGLVLIDPSHPEMFERVPNTPSARTLTRMAGVLAGMARLRLLGPVSGLLWNGVMPGRFNLPGDVLAAQQYFNKQLGVYETWQREAADIEESLRQARIEDGALGDKPLIVLTAGEMWATPGRLGQPEAMKKAMLQLRDELAHKSTRGAHRVVPGGTHTMQLDHPDAVVEAVREVVETIRSEQTLG